MITTELTYRLYEEKDLPHVLRLWEESSGWGAITEEQFHQWYLNTPYGPCIVIVASDEDDNVVGQLVFTPSHVQVTNKVLKAVRAAAPILHESFKGGKITQYEHPVFAMFRKGMEIAKQQGFSIIYLFPALGWTTVLKLFPRYGLPDMQPASYSCFSFSLQDPSTFYPKQDDRYVELLTIPFSSEYDQLWKEAASAFPIHCGVMRNASWLNWKLGGHTVFEIRDRPTKKLSGYIAVKKETGLIVDVLAKDSNNLIKNIQAVVHTLHYQNPDRISTPYTQLNGMYSSLFQSLFPNVETINFSFAFGCCSLNEAIGAEQVSPQNWYMMPND
ncbi:MAG TPA: GNAT family N-acetyltransferase [Flavisolibacter sp.]|jgi:hypothetical protein|nr:GNAT family N-acetyltransferase [Flavisolibacter sp.]